jgi:hypothetical protein
VIETIDDLVALTEAHAAMRPLNANEIRLRTPGCTENEIARLQKALPGLPESYLNVAKRVTLSFVSISGLVVSPGKRGGEDLFTRLTRANSPSSPQWGFVDAHGLYEVAQYPGSLVCVARLGTARAGEVLRIDYGWDGVDNLQLLRNAWSFDQLLLGFGRIREQLLAKRFGPDVVVEVLTSLKSDFAFDEEQMKDWLGLVGEAIGEE